MPTPRPRSSSNVRPARHGRTNVTSGRRSLNDAIRGIREGDGETGGRRGANFLAGEGWKAKATVGPDDEEEYAGPPQAQEQSGFDDEYYDDEETVRGERAVPSRVTTPEDTIDDGEVVRDKATGEPIGFRTPAPPPTEQGTFHPLPDHAAMRAQQVAEIQQQTARMNVAVKDQPFVHREATYQPQGQASQSTGVLLNTLWPSYADIDNLWDWVRHDTEKVRKFLPRIPANYHELSALVGQFQSLEQQGMALLRSVVLEGAQVDHLGFVLIYPIDRQARVPLGAVHLYLQPAYRHSLKTILPTLMQLADREAPGVTLTVMAEDVGWAQLLASAGFKPQLVLTRISNGHK